MIAVPVVEKHRVYPRRLGAGVVNLAVWRFVIVEVPK